MKRIIAIALLIVALPVTALAGEMPLTIGAASAGYGATAMDKGQHFTNYWAGLKTKELSSLTAIYTTYQHVGMNGGIAGNGIKALLVSGSEKIPWLELMFDLGVAFGAAEEADGSETAAFTVGGGAAFSITEYIAPFVYISAYDTGPRFSKSIQFGMAVVGIESLLKKAK